MPRDLNETSAPNAIRLRGLQGGGAHGRPPVEECVISRGAVRAGDRHEPWTFHATGRWRALADEATAHGLDFELTARLAVECGLICRDLRAAGAGVAAVDAVAAVGRVGGRLDAAASAYLRRLTQAQNVPRQELGESVTVGLPLRLSTRLLVVDVDALIADADADLDRAIAWEIAAVLAGRTMSEWAPLAALSSRRRADPGLSV